MLVQVLESTSGQVLGEASFVIQVADVDREVPARVAMLAKTLKALIPAKLALEPSPPKDAPLAVTGPPVEPRSMAPVWITGIGAVAFAGTAAGLLAMGASARACLNGPPVNGSPTVCVPASQAAAVGQRADVGATAGTVVGSIALGLAATTIVEWLVLKN